MQETQMEVKTLRRKKPTPEEVEAQKKKFEKGLRVQLVKRVNCHLPLLYTFGVVESVNEDGDVWVLFNEATLALVYYGLDELEIIDDYREEPYKLKMFKEMDELRSEEGVRNFLNIDYVKIEAANYYLTSIVTLIEEHPEKYLEYAREYMEINNIIL